MESELSLISKVELRIALANDDLLLQNTLKLYLPPLLLKLASPHSQVRLAILKIIQDILPRISASGLVKMPVESLLSQVSSVSTKISSSAAPETGLPTVQLYSLIFVTKFIDRYSREDALKLVPQVIVGISKASLDVSARLFYLLCRLLEVADFKADQGHQIKLPSNIGNQKQQNSSDLSDPEIDPDLLFLVDRISKFLMLRSSSEVTGLPGLSRDDVLFFNQKAGVSYKESSLIFSVKKRLLEFLHSGIFDQKSLVVPLLIASCDPSSYIKDVAEVQYKRLPVDHESHHLVNTLFDLFLGGKGVAPADGAVQESIINLLIKSSYALELDRITAVCKAGMSSENQRLRQSAIQLIKRISKHAMVDSNDSKTLEFSSTMAIQLKDSLMTHGWPKLEVSGNYQAAVNQRRLQFEALGELLKLNPSLFQTDISYINFLFDSLEGDNADLRSVIQDSLSGLSGFLLQTSENVKNQLLKRLSGYLYEEAPDSTKTTSSLFDNWQSCRYIAVKYVICAFPFSNAQARFLCILGTSKISNRLDIIEEAVKGLNPHWHKVLQATNSLELRTTLQLLGVLDEEVIFPSFSDMISVLTSALDGTYLTSLMSTLGEAITFCFQVLIMESIRGEDTVIVTDEDWATRLEKAVEYDEKVQTLTKNYIKSKFNSTDVEMDGKDDKSALVEFVLILFKAFADQHLSTSPSNIHYGLTLSAVLSLSPSELVAELTIHIPRVVELLSAKLLSETALLQVCQVLAIFASNRNYPTEMVKSLLNSLSTWGSLSSKKVNMLARSYLLSRLTLLDRIDAIEEELFTVHLNEVVNSLGDSSLMATVLECVLQMSLFGLLGPRLKLSSTLEPSLEILKTEIAKKVRKCDERATVSFAHLSLAFSRTSDSNDLDEFEQAVFDSHISKQTEYIFTSGEAFLILAAGWNSSVLNRSLDIDVTGVGDVIYVPENTKRLQPIFNAVMKACVNTKPSLRKSGCIWLLSLVQYCNQLSLIKNSAPKIHAAFMRFLADRDDLVQELASRGLTIVYELGDFELKDTLVRGLLKSFTDTNATSLLSLGTMDADTELFAPDLLKTNDGSVSTYRDVLSLASDVGDPSLVYKFMSLAKSSALWSSRKGIAFGLGSIMSKSSLDNLLKSNDKLTKKLIPKLYRYKFDPSTSVSNSMNDIWNVLVKDQSTVVKENFGLILHELIIGMGNKEWRVRQASTTAMIDLLQITPFETYELQLEKIWNMSFRIMDDIKDSVRKEGNKLTKNLSTTLLRIVEKASKKYSSNSDAEISNVLKQLFPFLLGSNGLLSDAEDVRLFSLDVILKLVKIGGSSIKEFIPELIDNFISLMSTLEPQVVNYLLLNADKYNLKSEDIDARRLQSIGLSPMMDALEKMLDSVDESMMRKTVDTILQSIKKAVGLPSKVCGSKVVVSLITRHLELSKPYGGVLLKVCASQITDKNDTVAAAFGVAAGYVCRIVSLTEIENYSKNLVLMYFESDSNDRNRYISALSSESVSKYSKDKFETISSILLPLAFIGRNDLDEDVRIPFDREWIENTSGNSSVKLYLTEITQLSSKYILSKLYTIRQIIAKALASAVSSIDSIQQFSEDTIHQVLNLLIEACKGKSWKGKELIFEALVLFSVKAENYLTRNPDLRETIDYTVITEIKRRNKSYQKQVLKIACKYVYAYSDEAKELVEVFVEKFSERVSDLVDSDDSSDDEDDMAVDSRNQAQVNVKKEEERLAYLKELFEAFNVDDRSINQDFKTLILSSIPDLFNSSSIENTWRSKLVSCEVLKALILKVSISEKKNISIEELFTVWKVLEPECLTIKEIENIKLQFLKVSEELLNASTKDTDIIMAVTDKLTAFAEIEKSHVVLTELQRINNDR